MAQKFVPPAPPIIEVSRARLAEPLGDPPVVARFIVEIRSDGSRTVARGALEDVANGERATIEARGTTPAALAGSLLKSLLASPLLGKVIGHRRLGGWRG
jgi:hypothetical protein